MSRRDLAAPGFSRREWVAAALALGSKPAAGGQDFAGTVVLGRPASRSVTANVHFDRPQREAFVEYGTEPGALSRRTPPLQELMPGTLFEGPIEDLERNSRYFYRVVHSPQGGDPQGASTEYSFHTQRSPGSEFTFTIIADSHLFTEKHCDPARYMLALENARDDGPDFHFDLGDTFRLDSVVRNPMDLTYLDVLRRSLAHRPYFGILTHSAPLFFVPGNHDAEYAWHRNPESGYHPQLTTWATNVRKLVYPNPIPGDFYSGNRSGYEGIDEGLRENYYAWEWGDALFVVLDPYWEKTQRNERGWGPIHGEEQYRWFRDTLRSSTAKHKFVFEHHLHGESRGGVEIASLHEWGGRDQKGEWQFDQMRPGWEKPMHDLMVETGVKIYFQGHDHLWAKGVLDGIVYLTLPMPGAGPDPSGPYYFPYGDNDDAYPLSEVLPNSGHVRVKVTAEGVDVEYVAVKLPSDAGVNRQVVTGFRL